MPVDLHAVTERHPEVGLLLGSHGLPTLLDAGEGGVGNGMVGSEAALQGVQGSNWARTDGGLGARHSASDGAKHCAEGGRWQHHVENESMDDESDSREPADPGTAMDSTGEESGGGVVGVG